MTTQSILNTEAYGSALEYVADMSVALSRVVLQRALAIDTVCLFAQSEKEYRFIESQIRLAGPVSHYSHGATLYIDAQTRIGGYDITLLGVRRPDASRPEIGYSDYPVADYEILRQLTAGNPFLSEVMSGRGQHLLELRHPDFDVRGYVVSKEPEHR